jgi:RNA polymerase-binding transcription factor DksA
MQKGWRIYRRVILEALIEHLQKEYNLDLPQDSTFRENLTAHQIDALIAFKSDQRLEALRGALARLEEGSFGVCLSCKRSIEDALLRQDPVRRMCSQCEQKFRAVQHLRQPWVPTYVQ